jgi:hypothetical protein
MAVKALLGLWPGFAIVGLLVRNICVHEIAEGAGGTLALARLKGILSVAHSNVIPLRSVPGLGEGHGTAAPNPHKALPTVGPI